VREVRRPDGEDGQLLHVPRLRHKHRLLVTSLTSDQEERVIQASDDDQTTPSEGSGSSSESRSGQPEGKHLELSEGRKGADVVGFVSIPVEAAPADAALTPMDASPQVQSGDQTTPSSEASGKED
jgi:hypothetical protein